MDGATETQDLGSLIEADSTSFAIPSELQWAGKAAEYVSRRAMDCGVCDRDRAMKMTLALVEAITNAIIHGNLDISSDLKKQSDTAFARAVAMHSADPDMRERPVNIQYEFDRTGCRVTITDQGRGFDYQSLLKSLDQNQTPSDLSSGRGILMMRAVADELEFSEGGRRVRLTWRTPQRTERRHSHRRAWNQIIRVLPLGDDGMQLPSTFWKTAFSRDVSPDGVSLIQPKPLESQRVLIEFVDEGEHAYAAADVYRMTMLEDGLIQIGCRFQRDKTSATLPVIQRLIEELEHPSGPAHESRAHRRAGYSATVKIRPIGGEFRSAFSRDLSCGGMALLTTFELPVGPVEIRLPVPNSEDQLVSAEVVRCHKISDGVFDVGCRF